MEDLKPTQSYGQKVVGVKFNPSGMTEVDKIKQTFAHMIDNIMEQSAKEYNEFNSKFDDATEDEIDNYTIKSSFGTDAITDLKNTCMSLVKYYTFK